jgi:hypothetical protein
MDEKIIRVAAESKDYQTASSCRSSAKAEEFFRNNSDARALPAE